jgi:hypothetical protein
MIRLPERDDHAKYKNAGRILEVVLSMRAASETLIPQSAGFSEGRPGVILTSLAATTRR